MKKRFFVVVVVVVLFDCLFVFYALFVFVFVNNRCEILIPLCFKNSELN